jgi:hypothetical protein
MATLAASNSVIAAAAAAAAAALSGQAWCNETALAVFLFSLCVLDVLPSLARGKSVAAAELGVA